MEKLDISIPNVSDINLKSYNAIEFLRSVDDVNTDNVVLFLSDYLNVPKTTLENAAMNDVVDLYQFVLESIGNIKSTKEPLQKIKIKSNVYELIDFGKMPAIWYMTAQRLIAAGIKSHEVAALCYIEQNKTFQETDLNKRKDLFELHMTAAQYHPLNGFFLQKYNRFREPFLELQRLRTKELNQTPVT